MVRYESGIHGRSLEWKYKFDIWIVSKPMKLDEITKEMIMVRAEEKIKD